MDLLSSDVKGYVLLRLPYPSLCNFSQTCKRMYEFIGKIVHIARVKQRLRIPGSFVREEFRIRKAGEPELPATQNKAHFYSAVAQLTSNHVLIRSRSTDFTPLLCYSLSNLTLKPVEVPEYDKKQGWVPNTTDREGRVYIVLIPDIRVGLQDTRYIDLFTMKIFTSMPAYSKDPVCISSPVIALTHIDRKPYSKLLCDYKETPYLVYEFHDHPYYLAMKSIEGEEPSIGSVLEVIWSPIGTTFKEYSLSESVKNPSGICLFLPFLVLKYPNEEHSMIYYLDRGKMVRFCFSEHQKLNWRLREATRIVTDLECCDYSVNCISTGKDPLNEFLLSPREWDTNYREIARLRAAFTQGTVSGYELLR